MNVIITGAAGRIGRELIEELADTHTLCLIDRSPVPGRASVVADLAQSRVWTRWRPWSGFKPPKWTEAFQGVDVVLHLSADSRPEAPWPCVCRDNIQATWNVLEAAVRHRVRRVVFASSNWAVKSLERSLAPACYMLAGPKLSSEVPPHPLTPYGLSKAFGELVGRTFVEERQLDSFVAMRIGVYHPTPPTNEESRRLWIGTQDLRSLLRQCVEAEYKGFHVVYGVSAQPIVPYDLSYTCRLLSWEPQQVL